MLINQYTGSMYVDQTVTMYLSIYGPIAIFLGTFFFGESVVIAAAFLAGQGIWSVWIVFILSFLGTIISDSLWFTGGSGIKKFASKKITTNTHSIKHTLQAIERITNGKTFLSLLFIKFLYGTRIITIFYLASQKFPFRKFLLYNTLGTIIWLIIMITVGWLLGQGVKLIMVDFTYIEFAFLGLVIIIMCIKFLIKWITKKTLH